MGEGLSAAEALFLVEDAAQEVRGGDHALHDYLGLTGRDELDGLERRGGFSALLVDYLVVGEVYAERSGDFLNLVLVAYEDGVGYSGLAGAFDGSMTSASSARATLIFFGPTALAYSRS